MIYLHEQCRRMREINHGDQFQGCAFSQRGHSHRCVVVVGVSAEHALGAELPDGARRALKLVAQANARCDKAPVRLQLWEELKEMIDHECLTL